MRWRSGVALLAVLSMSGSAVAQTYDDASEAALANPSRAIVVLRVSGDEHVMAPLRAELSASGFDVVELEGPVSNEVSLAIIAERYSARAVLRTHWDGRGVDIWVERRAAAGEDRHETITVESPELAEQVLAFRAAEALRALGLEVGLPQDESERVASPSTEGRVTSRPRGRLLFELGPALVASPGGVPPQISLGASVGGRPHPRWSLSAFGIAPVWNRSVQGDRGSVRLSTLFWGASGEFVFFDGWTGQLAALLGVGSTITWMNGSPQDGYVSRDQAVMTFAPFVGYSAYFDLSPAVQVFGRVTAGATVPALTIELDDTNDADWGVPFVVATAGLRLSLFPSRD